MLSTFNLCFPALIHYIQGLEPETIGIIWDEWIHCLSSDPFSWGRLRWLLCYLVNINLEIINIAIALWVQCICNTTARSSNKFQILPTLLGCWQFQRTLKSKVLILRNYQIFEDKRNSDKPGKYSNIAWEFFFLKTYLL